MSDCCGVNAEDKRQRHLLWIVLGLNGSMYFVEFIAGWIADSSGLMADSLDMLADAMVYMVGLYAVGKTIQHKAKAALFNGSLQLLLATLILVDVIRRLIGGSEPQTEIMFWISVLALAVNLYCFYLLSRYKTGDINMRASWVCSRNDMLANVGVLLSAGLVYWLDSAIPDLLIGTIIALIIVHSSVKIIKESRLMLSQEKQPKSSCCG